MLSEEIKRKTIFIGNSVDPFSALKTGFDIRLKREIKAAFTTYKPECIYMYNFHPFLNYYISELAEKTEAIFIQHVQEPYVENKSVYGGLHQYLLYLFEYLQGRLLKKTDVAILSSKIASAAFDKRYPDFQGKKVIVPLMYEDIGSHTTERDDRKYITFIGPPVPAKGPDTFLDIVNYSERHNLGFEFILISRAEVSEPCYHKNSNLKIFHKTNISDEEISYYMSHSIATITPYKTAKQSSVVLTSYMYGTPVLSTNVGGLSEVISHLKTGYLLDLNANTEKWIKGLNFIKENLGTMSMSCRDYFIANFSEVNWPKYFAGIINKNE
jgi:glycosyltransferase involved in cell wall biosynthesis